MGLNNIGTPQIGNRAIIQLAIEAGIAALIQSLVLFGMDRKTLLEKVAGVLQETMEAMLGKPGKQAHPALNQAVIAEVLTLMQPGDIWGAINTDVLDKLLDYLSIDPTAQVAPVRSLPQTVPVAGPDSLTTQRDAQTPTQVTVTFPAPPEGFDAYEVYVSYRMVKRGDNAPVDGVVTDVIALPEGSYSIRVLYVDRAGHRMSRFGTPAQV